MPTERPADDCVQEEVRQQAAVEPHDDETAREGFELDLMDHGASEEGEHVGEHVE